jgi:hypothetical protein
VTRYGPSLEISIAALARAVIVDVVARFDAVDRKAQRARRAVPNGADDLVHATAARGYERLLTDAKHGRETVGTVSGVLADAAVVENRHLLAGVAFTVVGNPGRVLLGREADLGVRAVAEWL